LISQLTSRLDRIISCCPEIAPHQFQPHSGRHHQPNYAETVATLEHLIEVIRENNRYRESDEADQERRVSELEAGRRLLDSRWISVAMVRAGLWGTLAYLASKFIDAPIGEAASLAWSAIKKLLGFS
jgi:hypothetical protein